jgi:Protein of unknown function (DUF2849)
MVKAVHTPAAQVVTANLLRNGSVAYLAGDGTWVAEIGRAAVAAGAAAADALMAIAGRAVADQVVVAPYLIEVAARDGGVEPLGVRERIRAAGPSIKEKHSHRIAASEQAA